MSSKAKRMSKKVTEEYSKMYMNNMYMNNMYELFNLSVFQLLKLRHQYLSTMKAREKEREQLVKIAKRRGIRI